MFPLSTLSPLFVMGVKWDLEVQGLIVPSMCSFEQGGMLAGKGLIVGADALSNQFQLLPISSCIF